MDEKLSWLEKSGFDCHVGNVFVGVIRYADDISLIDPTALGMNQMLDMWQIWKWIWCMFYANQAKFNFATSTEVNLA